MEFVNSIAKIVHSEVHMHGGAANKNIGDAFLLVICNPRHCLRRHQTLLAHAIHPADLRLLHKTIR